MDNFFKDLLELLNPESPYFNKNILAHIILKHGVFYQERINAKDESIIDGVVAEALLSLEMERDFTERFSLQLKEEIKKELKKITKKYKMTKPIFIMHAGVADVTPEDRNEYLQAIIDSLDEELDADWHVIVSPDVNSNTNRFEAFAVEKIEHIDFEALKKLLLKDIEDELDISDQE